MIGLFLENWFILIVVWCLLTVAFFYLKKFKRLPKQTQVKIIKEMIYSMVIQAEKEFGGKTGQAKFAHVIELFYSACPVDLRKFITEDMTLAWINEAVERMKKYFETNQGASENILNTNHSEN